ncbi:peptide chain release factor 3 [Rickettsiales endosymbiont of Stachyamoeba lipophora]|uniref:peptide chain release factor 3 n=1 Tax=Rickettsiales endosymbiont of Stachyamoeba lipophora TaxID=2486578 RepID=UPI000F64CD20|nr:peptide chain release factor 3 [Rickettsiales endosymbiont of Stachyamoeba lipophora]AZL16068.1 peptide chain release factor 3 [Rickettsiales endosymbiont of Stachyamoeba lipophora]
MQDITKPHQSNQRRTFAIISHPDAGKTTLTEKLLLNSGAIHIAGEVKARGARRHAHSDWMEMERKRGISITSSVMTFEHAGLTFNLLDTPGHQDFSEDTYRTLTAVDSAIMVIDAAKGIETQTLKLFEVCRMRNIPIVTFINKFDREARDPFELLDEIEQKLALDASPINWPIGMGKEFKGCFQTENSSFLYFQPENGGESSQVIKVHSSTDTRLADFMSPALQTKLIEDTELMHIAGKAFDTQSYREGHLTPVYFGSALRNFGIKELLEGLTKMAPCPNMQPANPRPVSALEPKVTGFVFKVQANMDPNHRDRIAFLRICSGTFKRGMKLKQTRTGKLLAIQNPVFFLARERQLTQEAYPGDIIGIPNHGTLRIGDTLSEGEDLHFKGIPSFTPEILKRVHVNDPIRIKHLRKALEDLAEEGILQLFKPILGSQWVIGVVGQLQLDVVLSRMESEYNLSAIFESSPYETTRWLFAEDPKEIKKLSDLYQTQIAEDKDGIPVYLARDNWDLKRVQEKFPNLVFAKTREQYID